MSQRLTPVDILNHRFRRRLRGYAAGDVDDYLRRAAADLEASLTECASLRDKVAALERELAQFRALEATLRDALVLAQKAADDTRAAARAHADAALQDAHTRVQQLEIDSRERRHTLTEEIDRLQREKRRLVRDLRAQLAAQLDWLDKEIEPDDAPAPPVAEENPTVPVSVLEIPREPLPEAVEITPDAPAAHAVVEPFPALEPTENGAAPEPINSQPAWSEAS